MSGEPENREVTRQIELEKQREPYTCVCCGNYAQTGERYCGRCGGPISERGECVLCQCRRQGDF